MALERKTDEDLREQSGHVLYEIQMFYALLRYFETGEVDAAVARLDLEGLPVRNAVIEAFSIHGRQLIEFLTEQRNRHRATAGDFTSEKWELPPERQELQQLQAEFSERVAHLSWQRARFTDDERLIMTHEIEAAMRPLVIRFLEQADPEKLCEEFLGEARWALVERERKQERSAQVFEATITSVATTQSPGTNAGTATAAFHSTAEQVRRDE